MSKNDLKPKERYKIPRQSMPEQEPEDRVKNFNEVPFGYSPETARIAHETAHLLSGSDQLGEQRRADQPGGAGQQDHRSALRGSAKLSVSDDERIRCPW